MARYPAFVSYALGALLLLSTLPLGLGGSAPRPTAQPISPGASASVNPSSAPASIVEPDAAGPTESVDSIGDADSGFALNARRGAARVPFVPLADSAAGPRARYAVTSNGLTAFAGDDAITYLLAATAKAAPSTSALGPGSVPTATVAPAEPPRGWVLRESLVGARPTIATAAQPAPTTVSYLSGSDPASWRSGVPTYDAVEYGEVYDRVTLTLGLSNGAVEKVFAIAPGGDAGQIAVRVAGAADLALDPASGDLLVSTGVGGLRLSAPVAYQDLPTGRAPVEVAYRLAGDTYGFALGSFDPAYAVVVDPTLRATYLGGTGNDELTRVAVDTSGNVYAVGQTRRYGSANPLVEFPTTTGAYDTSYNGGDYDVVVVKLSSDLKTLLAATYLGGELDEYGTGLAFAPDGNLVVVGHSCSAQFPTTTGAFRRQVTRWDAFVAKLSPNLSTLVASTFFGGYWYDFAYGVAVSPTSGDVYIAGQSDTGEATKLGTLPATGYDKTPAGGTNAFVARLNSSLTAATGFTFLGGDENDPAYDLALDSHGNVFVAVETTSDNFPTTAGAYATTRPGGTDAALAKLSGDLNQLLASTYLGGAGDTDKPKRIGVDHYDAVFVTGATMSADFPVTPDAYSTRNSGGGGHWTGNSPGSGDVFVSRLSSDLKTLLASTFLGSAEGDIAYDLVLDQPTGEVYVAGQTYGAFPTSVGAVHETPYGGCSYPCWDGFAARMDGGLHRLLASTLLGGTSGDNIWGIARGPTGDVVVVGATASTDFPVSADAYQKSSGGGLSDAYIASMPAALGDAALIAGVSGPRFLAPGTAANFMVQYRNATEQSIRNVVLVADVPARLDATPASTGGTFFPTSGCTSQYFWKLGDLAPQAQGAVPLRIEVPWGTPDGTATVEARIASADQTSPVFDTAPYLSYQPADPSPSEPFAAGELDAFLAGNPTAAGLLAYVKAQGYFFSGDAYHATLSDGSTLARLHLLAPGDAAGAVLNANGDRAFVEVFRGDTYTVFTQSGGLSWDRAAGQFLPFGDWVDTSAGVAGTSEAAEVEAVLGLREARCQFNCTLNSIPDTVMGKVVQSYGEYKHIKECVLCAQSMANGNTDYDNCAKCAAKTAGKVESVIKRIPGIGTAVSWTITVKNCLKDCLANPDLHICTQDKVECGDSVVGWLGGFGTIYTTTCNKTTGTYAPASYRTYCTYAEPYCVDGKCQGKPRCSGPACRPTTFRTRAARDPNAKSSSAPGDVLAGQVVTYTVEYENVGAGEALEVFVLDTLDPNLDAATLSVQNGGTYAPATRTLSWDVGTLAAGKGGSVKFSAQVKSGVAVGTTIANQAEVHFPSAFEVTPTNAVVSTVRAVVADPQNLTATSGVALPLTLAGRGASGGSVTYRITSPPTYGTLQGTAPNLTYQSDAQFVGQDEFAFAAASGATESMPARVVIDVQPSSADKTAPTVLATDPRADATRVGFLTTKVSTSPDYYAPSIRASFSEQIDPTKLTAATFTVQEASGALAGSVVYDAATLTVRFAPSAALKASTTYTATLKGGAGGVKDLAGNALAADYAWSFKTASPAAIAVTLPDGSAAGASGSTLHGDAGVTGSDRVSVASVGTANLQVGKVALGGASPASFVLTDGCSSKALPPGQSCALRVSLASGVKESQTATLSIPSNDADASTVVLTVTGEPASGPAGRRLYLPYSVR